MRFFCYAGLEIIWKVRDSAMDERTRQAIDRCMDEIEG